MSIFILVSGSMFFGTIVTSTPSGTVMGVDPMCDAATADALKNLVLEEMLEGLDAKKKALVARREIVLEIMGGEARSVCFNDVMGRGYDLTIWKREKRKGNSRYGPCVCEKFDNNFHAHKTKWNDWLGKVKSITRSIM
jgi:hypothetical protein